MAKEFTYFPDGRLKRLITLFDECFLADYNTQLVGGAEEPVYRPGFQQNQAHQVIFTRDYFSSALHEIAHWCVAGRDRWLLEDFGYWYAPDGRSESQQQKFEKVEVKPQAMERIFSQAAGQVFRVSADNLSQSLGASESFIQNIHTQTLTYCDKGLPKRANKFALALAETFGQVNPLKEELYTLSDLT